MRELIGADGFVDGHDASYFGGLDALDAEQLELGIGHFDAA